MELRETRLPGVGLRHDFTTSGGRQLARSPTGPAAETSR
jgi:hypothetical protein